MSARTVVVRYAASERRRILVLSLLGTVFDGADFAVFVFFLAPLAATLHVGLLRVEWIQATSYLASLAGAAAFGVLGDRYGRRPALAATIATYGLASLASAFAPSYPALFALRLVTGFGIGGEAGLAIAYLNEAWRPERRGAATALLQGMFVVGSALASALFAWTSARFGPSAWRWAFGLLGTTALLAVAVRVWMPESRVWLAQRARTGPGAPTWWRLPRAGLGRLTAVLAGLTTATFFAAYAVETYAPAALLTVYRLRPRQVADLALLGLAVVFAAYLAFGGWSDRSGRRRATAAAAAFGTVGFLAYAALLAAHADRGALPGHLPLHTLVALLWMLAAAGPLGVQGVWWAELFPTEVRAAAVSTAYYLGRGLGGGLAPLAALAIAQRLGGDLRLAMASGVLGAAAAVVLALRLGETRGRPLPLSLDGADAAVPE
jgi:MFS family permease